MQLTQHRLKICAQVYILKWLIPLIFKSGSLAPAHLDVEKYTRDGFRRNGMILLAFYGPPR